MRHADTDQEREEFFVAGHVAADGNGLIEFFACIDDFLYRSQNSRVARLIKIGDPFVSPVYRKHVLHKIVCADTQKIGALRQVVNDVDN